MTRAAVLASALLSACVELPSIRGESCGNGAVEAGEDCDLYAGIASPAGHACGLPEDSVRACRWICTGRLACPSGWGCGQDGVCRRPSGDLVPLLEVVPVTYLDFVIGDVDGDGAADLVGRTRAPGVDVFYGAGAGGFAGPDRIPTHPSAISIGIADLDQDGALDVAAPAGAGLLIALGDEDRSLATLLHATFDALGEPPHARLALDVGDRSELALLTAAGPGTEVTLPEHDPGAAVLPVSISDLAGPVQVDLDGDGDEDLVAGAAGQPELWVVLVDLALSPPVRRVDVPLPSGLTGHAEGAPPPLTTGDVDGDGRLDLLAGVSPAGVVVAAGQGGGAFAAAAYDDRFVGILTPDARCPPTGSGALTAMPLAAARLDGDALADYVAADGIYLSRDDGGPPYVCRAARAGVPWLEAVIVDLNRDGEPDVVATSGAVPEVEVFLGDGSGVFSRFGVDLVAPGHSLRTGDFDGDRVTDVALLGLGPDGQSADVVVLFGAVQGPPAPVSMGAVGSVTAFEPLRLEDPEGVVDLIDDVLVEWTNPGDGPGDRHVAFVTGTNGRRMLAPLILGPPIGAAALGRFDGDEHTDLAAVSLPAAGAAMAFTVPGIGPTFEPPFGDPRTLCPGFNVEATSSTLRAVDLVGDPRDELVFVYQASGFTVAAVFLLTSSSDAPLAFDCAYLTDLGFGSVDVIPADLDGDGRLDLLIAGLSTVPQAVVIYGGDDAPSAPELLPLPDLVGRPGALQLDTDPALEIVAPLSTGLYVLDVGLGRGFSEPELLLEGVTAGLESSLRSGDVDGDQIADLVISSEDGTRVLLGRPAERGVP